MKVEGLRKELFLQQNAYARFPQNAYANLERGWYGQFGSRSSSEFYGGQQTAASPLQKPAEPSAMQKQK